MFWALNEFDRAVADLTEAVSVAGDLTIGVWARLSLSGALRDCGSWNDAWRTAFEAFHLARTVHRGASRYRIVSEGLMSLLGPRNPALLDALFAEVSAVQPSETRRRHLDLRKAYVETLQSSGQLQRAAERLRDLFSEADHHPDPHFRIDLILLTSSLRTDEGRIQEGSDIYREVLRQELEAEAYGGERAIALLNRASAIGERLRFNTASNDFVAALWRQVKLDAEEARASLSDLGAHKLATLAAAVSARASGYEDPRSATIELERLRPQLIGVPACLGEYHLIRGDLEAQQQQWASAGLHYEKAVEFFSSIDRPLAAAQGQEMAAAMAERNETNDKAISLRAAARRRRWALIEVERYRPSSSSEEADRANARGLEQLSMAADGAVDQLRAARAAFHSACAATTPITWYYTLNLAYACAALGEWAEAAEALESALVNGPDWLSTTKLIQDWKTDLRRKEISRLETLGRSHLSERRLVEAAAAFAAALELARSHVPLTDREAPLSAALALVRLQDDDEETAITALAETFSRYREQFSTEASAKLGRAWAASLLNGLQYRDINRRLKEIETKLYTTPELQRAMAGAREGLASNLDSVFTADSTAPEPFLPPVVIPILLELGSGLPKDQSQERWTRLRERIQMELGVEVQEVRVRSNPALGVNQYSVFINQIRVVTGEAHVGSRYCSISDQNLATLGALIGAVRARHPATEEGGFWIPEANCESVERAGFVSTEPIAFVMEHLETVVRTHLSELLSFADIEKLLSRWSSQNQSLTRFHEHGTLVRLAAVVRGLLEEQVPVAAGAEICQIVETLPAADTAALIRAARMRVKDSLPGNESLARRAVLPDAWEQTLCRGLKEDGAGVSSEVAPQDAHAVLVDIRKWLGAPAAATAIVVRSPELRFVLRRILAAEFPKVAVLAAEELLVTAVGPGASPETNQALRS